MLKAFTHQRYGKDGDGIAPSWTMGRIKKSCSLSPAHVFKKPTAVPFNERKCTLCLKLEDEFHFLLEYPLYKDLRKKSVKQYYWKNANMLKFIELITS